MLQQQPRLRAGAPCLSMRPAARASVVAAAKSVPRKSKVADAAVDPVAADAPAAAGAPKKAKTSKGKKAADWEAPARGSKSASAPKAPGLQLGITPPWGEQDVEEQQAELEEYMAMRAATTEERRRNKKKDAPKVAVAAQATAELVSMVVKKDKDG